MITTEEARRYYDGHDAAHDFDHVLRVLALAERIGQTEGADMEVVRAAALLHDVGRGQQERTGRSHAELGSEQARQILTGVSEEIVEAICHAIAAHRFRGDIVPQTLEAKVLYDADKLDSMGAVGIARVYLYGGGRGQRLWGDALTGFVASEESEAYTPVHEFVSKLARLQDTLHTEAARKIGLERHAYMVEFFQRLEREVCGHL